MPEAFQPVDHLVVSRAASLAKESLKTGRQLPGMPSGLADAAVLDAGALGVLVALGALEEAGAEAGTEAEDVLVAGAVGVDAGELDAEVGTGVDGEDCTGTGRWWRQLAASWYPEW